MVKGWILLCGLGSPDFGPTSLRTSNDAGATFGADLALGRTARLGGFGGFWGLAWLDGISDLGSRSGLDLSPASLLRGNDVSPASGGHPGLGGRLGSGRGDLHRGFCRSLGGDLSRHYFSRHYFSRHYFSRHYLSKRYLSKRYLSKRYLSKRYLSKHLRGRRGGYWLTKKPCKLLLQSSNLLLVLLL